MKRSLLVCVPFLMISVGGSAAGQSLGANPPLEPSARIAAQCASENSVAQFFRLCQLASSPSDAAITLDHTKQLFLDDFLIASRTNITRRVHAAQKHSANPLIWPHESWEGAVALLYGSVIRDRDKYRMWYLSGPGVSYAESKDGIAWVKPSLGLYQIEGHETNVVARGPAGSSEQSTFPYCYELLGVHKDPREKDPARRYKMGFVSIQFDYEGPREDVFHRGQRRGLGVAASPDGIHWELINSWATETVCDGPGHWMFDPARGKYVLYGRTKHIPPEVQRVWDQDAWCQTKCWGRAVTRIESSDFVEWDLTERGVGPVVLAPDARDPVGAEIYSMMVFPYESVYIGLVQVYHNHPEEHYLDVQLAVSRDGVHFTRVGDRSPFIPVGPLGSWDRFNNSIANNLPIVVGDELRFYYSGRTYRHGGYPGSDKGISGGGIGVASIKRDRFVSLGASFDGGQVTTKPVKLAGKTLHVNARADFGKILVEMLDERGTTIARSIPIRRDALSIPVHWELDKVPAASQAVRLRITIENALLFALWCE